MRAFPVRMPSGVQYWTVIDSDLRVVPAADAYLRHLRFGRDAADSTTKAYAGAVVLFLSWCAATGQDWRLAAERLPSFVLWLRYAPSTSGAAAGAAVRGPRRINCVLAGTRGFLAFAVDRGDAPAHVLGQLYELADSRDLPAEARGEDGTWRLRMRARHRVPVVNERVDRVSDEDAGALLKACRSARDRLLVLLLGRAGLRRGEAVGLRREDVHFAVESSALGANSRARICMLSVGRTSMVGGRNRGSPESSRWIGWSCRPTISTSLNASSRPRWTATSCSSTCSGHRWVRQ